MKIRREPVLAWHQRNEPAFVEAILEKVRHRHPTYRQTDEMLRESITVGIRRAQGNGLKGDRLVSEFVLIMFEVAPNFDQQPDIRAMLDTRTLPAEERWERLFTPQFDPAWDEADDPGFYDENAWFDHPVKDLKAAEWPSETEWAELVALNRIKNKTSAGQPVREPTLGELGTALNDIRNNVAANQQPPQRNR